MRKKIKPISLIIAATVTLSACGSASAEPSDEMQIQSIAGMEEVDMTRVSVAQEQMDTYLELNAEAEGDEETTVRNVTERTEILSKPSADANVLAEIKSGTAVEVIGLLENQEFYKIVYYGRIAYIGADSLLASNHETVVAQRTGAQEEAQASQQNTTTSPSANNTSGNNNYVRNDSGNNTSSQQTQPTASQGTTTPSGSETSSPAETGDSQSGEEPSQEEPTSPTEENPTDPSEEETSAPGETEPGETPSDPNPEPSVPEETNASQEGDGE